MELQGFRGTATILWCECERECANDLSEISCDVNLFIPIVVYNKEKYT